MSTDNFEKTSWGWQLSQFQQQVAEWVEWQLYRLESLFPRLSLDESPRDYSWLESWLKSAAWMIAGLFLIWLGWRLWKEFSPYVYAWLSLNNNSLNNGVKTREIELSVAEWLGKSQELYRQGNYRQAFLCLYLGMLQRLHDRQIAVHKRSRTDGEYLQLVNLALNDTQAYETLLRTHEQVCFADTEIGTETYEQCRQAYQEISEL